MYLIDTNIISEARKQRRANPGVLTFFNNRRLTGTPLYLSSITIGELQRGVAMCSYRNDEDQANKIERWLNTVVADFSDNILPFCSHCARVWGHLCSPDNTNVIDKQIAATALVYDLTLVTRHVRHVAGTGVRVVNPFDDKMRY